MTVYTKIKAAFCFVIISVFMLLCGLDAIPRLDAMAGDMLLSDGAEPASEIVILTIDDDSINALGRFPWPRSTYAALLENLADSGAAVIGLDILFTEPSDEYEDEALMEAIAYAGNVVLPMQANIRVGQKSEIDEDGVLLAHGAIYPIPMLAAQAADFGHINAQPDDWDSFIRRGMGTFRDVGDGTLIRSWDEVVYEQFCLRTGREYKEVTSRTFFKRPYIHFAGPPGTITHYPIFAALDPDIIDPSEFAGKIVLVGAFTTSLTEDSYFTPASGVQRMYGVEIHANIINNMLNGDYVTPTPRWLNIFTLLLFCAAAAFFQHRIRRALLKFCLVIGVAAVAAGSWYLLFRAGMLASVSYTLLALVCLYLIDVLISYMAEFGEKHRVISMFGRYLAPQVLDKVVHEGEGSLQLGGEERDLTVLFVDIRGFTALSEMLSPTEVVEILNEYLTLATEAVFAFGGMLDKYIGDAVMALYNVPYDQEDHTLCAVKSALQMQRHGIELNAELEKRFGRAVHFGVGVNTGRAVVGNIGSPARMDYTAIGDVVNVSARLESNAKAGQVLISSAVYEKVKDEIEADALGGLKVKGRAGEVQAYQVNGLKGETS